MIVKKLESPVYYRKERKALPGKGKETQLPRKKRGKNGSFEQFLMEAFEGEVVQRGNQFSENVSELTRENLIRLSQL